MQNNHLYTNTHDTYQDHHYNTRFGQTRNCSQWSYPPRSHTRFFSHSAECNGPCSNTFTHQFELPHHTQSWQYGGILCPERNIFPGTQQVEWTDCENDKCRYHYHPTTTATFEWHKYN